MQVFGIRDQRTWSKILGGAAASLFVVLLSVVLMPAATVVTWVVPGVLICSLLALVSMELHQRADHSDQWKASMEAFRDQMGIVAAFLGTSADMFQNWLLSKSLPIKWNEVVNRINWPADMRKRPLKEWRAKTFPQSEAAEGAHKIAYGCGNAWPGHVEFAKARRDMVRTLGDWVAAARGPYGKDFCAFIEPFLQEWRNPIVMLAYLEIVQAEANTLSDVLPGDWADMGAEWPHVFMNRPIPAVALERRES